MLISDNPESRIVEVTDEEAEKFMSKEEKQNGTHDTCQNGSTENAEKVTNTNEKEDEEDPEDKGKIKPNSGNGCDLPHGKYVDQLNILPIRNIYNYCSTKVHKTQVFNFIGTNGRRPWKRSI